MKRKSLTIPTGLLLTGAIWPVVSHAEPADTFATLDQNRDGYLSVAEAGNEYGLLEKFSELDKNADGQLSKEEWLAGRQKSE
ncbi:MAG: EF-hand domain-containing protein [Gammaproteobacteria bacterium]